MQKKDIIELIKYHAEKNDHAFRNKAYEIARYFDNTDSPQLAGYIMALLSDANAFVPQMHSNNLKYFRKETGKHTSLPLPNEVADEISGAINAVNRRVGIHKILFEGGPGTGKTETVYSVAKILDREIYSVNFSSVIDSRLGQTAKNMTEMFDELRTLPNPSGVLILFDEIDAIALDRINTNDLREMGRVTSTLLKELDALDESIVCIATTNLYRNLDQAVARRFDSIINFDKYSHEDLVEVGVYIFNQFAPKFDDIEKDAKLLKKLLSLQSKLPMPGELKNVIKTSLAFSSPRSRTDYLRRLYTKLYIGEDIDNIRELKRKGFTVREIAELVEKPKTRVARELNEDI